MSSGQLLFASHTCANSVPICKHGSPSLEAIDARTLQTLATSERYSMLAVGDHRLWATDPQATSPELVALDQRRLTPAGALRLPASPTTAAVLGEDIWAAGGSTLSEISTTPLHVTRALATGGRITDMASSPDGKSLWDVIVDAGGLFKLQLRSGATGAIEASWKPPAGLVSLGGLTADDTGVWIAELGGMTTVLARLQTAPIRVTVKGGEPDAAGGPAHFDLIGQPITALDADNVLWTDISGQELACGTPSGGVIRSKSLLATLPSTGSFVATGSDLFVATTQGIDLVRPPAACRVRPAISTTKPPATSGTPAPAPTAADTSSGRTCTGRHIIISLAKRNPGNSSQPSAYLAVHNIGALPCELDGYPLVAADAQPRHAVRIRHGSSYEITDPGPRAVQLNPGAVAYFGIGWVQANPPCTSVIALRLALVPTRQPTTINIRLEACSVADTPPVLDVTAIRPAAAFTAGASPA